MKVDLNAASNMLGPLSGEARSRIMAAINDPCEATWDDAKGLILNPDVGLGLTLWQAVIKVDPSFASVKGPVTRWVEDDSQPVSGWSRTPDAETILQAISYATR